jgi:hypothetical protein
MKLENFPRSETDKHYPICQKNGRYSFHFFLFVIYSVFSCIRPLLACQCAIHNLFYTLKHSNFKVIVLINHLSDKIAVTQKFRPNNMYYNTEVIIALLHFNTSLQLNQHSNYDVNLKNLVGWVCFWYVYTFKLWKIVQSSNEIHFWNLPFSRNQILFTWKKNMKIWVRYDWSGVYI